ncbi:MAG: Gfo/Idh/MocA family oxidoreductase [Devosia nanyangense]|uniref:Gfo/Idh/MocA family oxidoreductase n=1 Tax=Devosia nanyangense TaxID=1228055 RepID=A0A933L504_9HYPH|nr:Gfo/Idh/MocA family oxidoreductase [Devosia nanyangense]
MRVAVIGCGFQGRIHVEAFRRLAGVDVVAVADTDPQRLASVAGDFGVPGRFADYRALLAAGPYDLVSICTMAVHHAAMTIAAFAAGAHVLCEKPLALNVAEGEAMVDAARAAGRVLAVGYNMRFTPNARAISQFIASGRFGAPVFTRAWAKASQIPWWGEHYRKEVSGGGALASTAVHFLDLALYFAGFPEPLTASASATRLFPRKRGGTAPDSLAASRFTAEDLIGAHVRFAGGYWLSLEGSWIDNRPGVEGVPSWDYSLDAIGEQAQVSFDPLTIRGEAPGGEIVDLLPAGTSSDVSFPPSVAALIADVVDAVRNARPPLVTGEQALVVQRIVDAIYRSAELGREVTIARP